MQRPQSLAGLIDVARDAIYARVKEGERASAVAHHIFSALETAVGNEIGEPETLPVCRYLEPALDNARAGPAPIAALAEAFQAIRPILRWQRRIDAESLGASFYDGHANTWLVGPNGLEPRSDVIVGASLLAPGIRYPDHDHPPEELYVVMSEGEWFEEHRGWYTPGVGGIVYHPSGVTHAMRSGAVPLLALWCLWAAR